MWTGVGPTVAGAENLQVRVNAPSDTPLTLRTAQGGLTATELGLGPTGAFTDDEATTSYQVR